MTRIKISLPMLFTLMFLLAACSSAADQAATETAESDDATAVALGLMQTSEARSSEETQAAEDAAAEAELQTQTADKAATATSVASKAGTQQAKNAANTQQAEDELAAIDEILQSVGYSTSSGELGWTQSGSETIRIPSGNYRQWSGRFGEHSYNDFVIHFNTTWDTSGFAGCGLIFRSERDLLNGQQYIFDTVRFSGFPGWRIRLFQYSDFQANITGGVRFTDKLNLDNRATNNIVIVADGTNPIMFINGGRVGVATIATRAEGFFSFYAWQTDGSTTCTFEDGWIWELP